MRRLVASSGARVSMPAVYGCQAAPSSPERGTRGTANGERLTGERRTVNRRTAKRPRADVERLVRKVVGQLEIHAAERFQFVAPRGTIPAVSDLNPLAKSLAALDMLHKQGLIRHERATRSNVYNPTASRQELEGHHGQHFSVVMRSCRLMSSDAHKRQMHGADSWASPRRSGGVPTRRRLYG
jgi:hypothetical protein